MSRYQKGETNLDFTEARDSEWQWHQLEHMQVCTSLQTDNHANTPPLKFFTGRMPFLPPNQQRQSTEGTTQSTEGTDRSIKITLYLLSNIECSAVCLWMAPVTAENLAKYWIVRLLQALQESVYKQLIYSAFQCSKYQYGYSTTNYLMRWHLNHDKLQKTEALIFIFNLQSNITEYTRKQLVDGLYSKQVTTNKHTHTHV